VFDTVSHTVFGHWLLMWRKNLKLTSPD